MAILMVRTMSAMVQPGPQDAAAVDAAAFRHAVAEVARGADPVAVAGGLVALLTDDERLAVLHGDTPFWQGRAAMMEHGYNHVPYPMGAVPRLGVPGVRFVDGPRGVVVGHATAFPVPMARGASWDVGLEQEIGRAIGLEVRACGGNLFGGVCVNLPRHPAWGRSQETYSDQPLLLGEMAAALVRGVGPNAMTCVKHFALNSMENARFDVDVRCDEATLHEDFLPHFRRAIEAGASSVMCAYNAVNGAWASESRRLLTDILRESWGFDGFVISDFVWAIRDAARSLEAGLDLEAPFAQLRAERLPAELAAGRASLAAVQRSAVRVLATQLRFFARRELAEPDPAVVAGAEHVALARRAAARSMVLLRNEEVDGAPVLPFTPGALGSLAVVGRLADVATMGDQGSSNVHAASAVTPLDGLRAALPGTDVRHDDGADPRRAAAVAARTSAAVVVVGYTAAEEGEWVNGRIYVRDDLMALYPEPRDEAERWVRDTMLARAGARGRRRELGGDRTDLRLPSADVALVRAVAAANPHTVVVLICAGAVLMSEWHREAPGLVVMWYAGMQGGHALADLLLGAEDFSGRLPYAIPADEGDLPFFDAGAREITYDRWYGQRKIAHDGGDALYPLGFGLSYTSFALSSLRVVDRVEDGLDVEVDVANSGRGEGRAVVQVYGTRQDGDRAGERELLGFGLAALDGGQRATLRVHASLRPLSRWDAAGSLFRLPPGPVRIEAAQFWGDPAAAVATVTL